MAHSLGCLSATFDPDCEVLSSGPDPDESQTLPSPPHDLSSPFDHIDVLDCDDFAEAAYQVFFTAYRSSPGRHDSYCADEEGDGCGSCSGSTAKPLGVDMVVTSLVKRALGLKMMRRPSAARRSTSCGGNLNSLVGSDRWIPRLDATLPPTVGKLRRPMAAAEIMRRQMRVTEQSDNQLRKTLMRTLVGQMGRRAETIILPMELLRHLKPSEFDDAEEYHQWQKRQLKILKAGLLLHPSIPLDKSDASAAALNQIIDAAEAKPLDTGKNSDSMRALCNCVVSLAWRSPDGGPTDICHWADGYPFNVEIYMSLLRSVFDMKDETLVLDEVDELLEVIRKTWSILGINRAMHNLCFAWKLFEHYVVTGQVEPDLLAASLTMLIEVANDAKKADRDPIHVKMLESVLFEMKRWCEKTLLDYHKYFDRANIGLMESILPLVFSVTKIIEDGVTRYIVSPWGTENVFDDDNKVDRYIRSSSRNAFAKMVEDHNAAGAADLATQKDSNTLTELARKTKDLAAKEKDVFSPVLKKWYPCAAGVSIATLHACFGVLLKQYLSGISELTNETILMLQRARKLEKELIQMVVEDSVEYEDGGKAVIREIDPYDIDTVIIELFKLWIDERLRMGRENLQRTKETETWNPKSKTEPYARSAAELIQFAKEAVESFFSVPLNVLEISVRDLSDGLEHLLDDYITLVASCGTKQSYLPSLPPLTRCSRDSRFLKLWKRACSVGVEDPDHIIMVDEGNHPRPSTSRGTQRLYIRLNTLHYLLSQLHFLDKELSSSRKIYPQKGHSRKHLGISYFDKTREAIRVASQSVAEVAAYRLIFMDSNSFFYGSLYVTNVANTRIKPALRILKQNITLLCAIVTDRAQRLALKELMKTSFQGYLMVLLGGGSRRIFTRLDHPMIEEDFASLKRLFCTCGDGLIEEDEVERESEVVEGVVALMAQSTEQLVEEFSTVAREISGVDGVGAGTGQRLEIPPTTGRWNRSEPNTILRVICHRSDRIANHFLKRTFQLPKRTIAL